MRSYLGQLVAMSLILCILWQAALAACTRHFDLTVTWENGAPDGVQRDIFKINGQFPGPTLELNEGDDVVVVVKNQSPYNTTIHYHGKSDVLDFGNEAVTVIQALRCSGPLGQTASLA